ncbi:hypothetical protein WB44_04445 [Synechococcus sp. WH 8020]|nr:hypothetical protein WB44_04445 [Synechococcus sp. WH 8020]
MLQKGCHRESGQTLLMQGAFELGLIAILVLGLQVCWVSTVLLNRPRSPYAPMHSITSAMLWRGSLEHADHSNTSIIKSLL